MGVLKSDLIAKIGHEGLTTRVLYTDGKLSDYFNVPLSRFRAIGLGCVKTCYAICED
jgi:hypothetical protein